MKNKTIIIAIIVLIISLILVFYRFEIFDYIKAYIELPDYEKVAYEEDKLIRDQFSSEGTINSIENLITDDIRNKYTGIQIRFYTKQERCFIPELSFPQLETCTTTNCQQYYYVNVENDGSNCKTIIQFLTDESVEPEYGGISGLNKTLSLTYNIDNNLELTEIELTTENFIICNSSENTCVHFSGFLPGDTSKFSYSFSR